MHPVTLAAIILELVLFGAQLAFFLNHPADRNRIWYLVLLVLLIFKNLTGGLFPDPGFSVPVYIQNIIAYGFGFAVTSFLPYYFYRAFELKALRPHALYGVPLLLMLPYLGFFMIAYAIHEDLEFTVHYGILLPFAYSVVLLWVMFRAIRREYQQSGNRSLYVQAMAVYAAAVPWTAMGLVVWFGFGQLTQALFTNLGFLTITGLLLFSAVRQERKENALLTELGLVPNDPVLVASHSIRYALTTKETEVAQMICLRLKYREIADRIFNSPRTVDKHRENIFHKVGVSSREELIRKMNEL